VIVSNEAGLPQPRGMPPALVAMVAPDAGMERQARVGKPGLAVLIAIVCALFAAFAQASRVDARSVTLQKLEKEGQLTTMSDRQVDDETRNAERLFQVVRVASGAFEAPAFLLVGGLAVVVLVWFLKGKLKGRAVFPVSAAVLLPGALANLLDGITALRMGALPPGHAVLAPRNLAGVFASLGAPLSGAALKLGTALDFFSLWAAVLMAFGVAAAGDVPTRRALIGTLCAWVCLRLVLAVAIGG
jgi:Yip1 domain